VGDAELPTGTLSPNAYNTSAGALGAYRGVKSSFIQAFFTNLRVTGVLTDELTSYGLATATTVFAGLGQVGKGDPKDERILPEKNDALVNGGETGYGSLQSVRGGAMEAIGLLANYAPATSPALRGEMYALQGYAEVLLAESFCSGVPLSTLDFQQDFTYKPGSTTTEVLQHALALLDTAVTLSSDSANVEAMTQVLRGRVLLDLGRYAEAGQAAVTVPANFQYQMSITLQAQGVSNFNNWNVGAQEGENGLPFSTANDPRVVVTPAIPDTNIFGVPQYWPGKYPAGMTKPMVLASGVEARLIEAEVALNEHADDLTWLTILNSLRTTCVDVANCPTPAPAGIGGVAGLPPLRDPGKIGGNDSARVTLLFTERAYWLFLTGHRQGDLRRLVRNYGRPQETVYPTGSYYGGYGFYGTDVSFPIPSAEQNNPLFHGCLNRGA
jgi:hypothetical protein